MPYEKGNKAALGNKGGGRKSTKCEFTREEMVIKAIGKWAKSVRSLDNLSDKQIDRINKLIMPIVSKAMPTEISGDLKILKQQIVERYDESRGKEDKTT